jgi:hypothetical protein
MKVFIMKALKQVASIFTDKDFDADVVKVFGVALVVAGIVGWWYGKADFQWIIGFAVPLIISGKFSDQG